MRALLLLVLLPACGASRALERGPISGTHPEPAAARDAGGITHVEANWKERLEQPYVFLEARGDYRNLGHALERLLVEVQALDLRGSGSPFALFFDDPGRVPLEQLRARVCWPVTERPARTGALQYELLPRAMVVYARVPGAHSEVARSYPALFSYLRELGWQQGGPVREIYLAGAQPSVGDQLLTEIQIPWTARAE